MFASTANTGARRGVQAAEHILARTLPTAGHAALLLSLVVTHAAAHCVPRPPSLRLCMVALLSFQYGPYLRSKHESEHIELATAIGATRSFTSERGQVGAALDLFINTFCTDSLARTSLFQNSYRAFSDLAFVGLSSATAPPRSTALSATFAASFLRLRLTPLNVHPAPGLTSISASLRFPSMRSQMFRAAHFSMSVTGHPMVVKITPHVNDTLVGASNTACAVGSAVHVGLLAFNSLLMYCEQWVERISALDASPEAHGSAAARQLRLPHRIQRQLTDVLLRQVHFILRRSSPNIFEPSRSCCCATHLGAGEDLWDEHDIDATGCNSSTSNRMVEQTPELSDRYRDSCTFPYEFKIRYAPPSELSSGSAWNMKRGSSFGAPSPSNKPAVNSVFHHCTNLTCGKIRFAIKCYLATVHVVVLLNIDLCTDFDRVNRELKRSAEVLPLSGVPGRPLPEYLEVLPPSASSTTSKFGFVRSDLHPSAFGYSARVRNSTTPEAF
ncbi:hypothetical protein C8R45DRAFT_1069631 [Mycena sanguinolenta]|nr:hypothetical protein C8R45DRAFT_1069631 [Mycena sanguinolenta]